MKIRTLSGSVLEPPSAVRATPGTSMLKLEPGGSTIPKIPFIRPSFPGPAELAEDFVQIAQANWYTNFGPNERRFARALRDYLGPHLHVATLANGTLALLAALHVSFGAGTRDRYLLMPSFTFVGVAQAALWTGYRPWFIDIDANTWQPCVHSARAVIERFRDRIAGILLANVFGVGNPQISVWEELAVHARSSPSMRPSRSRLVRAALWFLAIHGSSSTHTSSRTSAWCKHASPSSSE